MTGLGSGVPRAEGEEQLFASRESQPNLSSFRDIQVGEPSGSSGVRGGRDRKILEEPGCRRRKQVDRVRGSSNP